LEENVAVDIKGKWDHILAKEYDARKQGKSHGGYNWTSAYLELKGMEAYMTPYCECTVPCVVFQTMDSNGMIG
jgi:hypothetical protein